MEEKIKNCPFCGGIAMKMLIFGRDGIGCIECGAMMRPATIEDDVRNDWNKRATDSEIRAKAIDEFAEECKKRVAQGELYDYVRWCNWNNSVDKWFDRIAEQLKGGAE